VPFTWAYEAFTEPPYLQPRAEVTGQPFAAGCCRIFAQRAFWAFAIFRRVAAENVRRWAVCSLDAGAFFLAHHAFFAWESRSRTAAVILRRPRFRRVTGTAARPVRTPPRTPSRAIIAWCTRSRSDFNSANIVSSDKRWLLWAYLPMNYATSGVYHSPG